MATPGYTGQGQQAPRTEGRALQALSQFGQAEQVRNSQAIQQGVRDRDKFADMLKMDPVYATSQRAQERIGTIMDEFQDQMTAINKEKRGTLTTQDLVKMQQARGTAMAEMNYIKSNSDQLTHAYQMANANPGKFNQKRIDEAREQWDTQGSIPEGGLLIPAWQNPHERFNAGAQAYRQGATWEDKGSPYQDATGAWVQPQSRMYPMQAENPEANLEGMFLSGREGVNNLGWFAEEVHDNDPAVWKHYMKKAGDDEQLAAKMWFSETKPPAYPQASKDDMTKPRAAGQIGGDNLQLVNGSLWDGKYKQFDTAQNIPVADGTIDKGILFTRKAAKDNLIPVPSRLLELQDGIETKGGTVDARVHVADNNKTYLVINKGSLDNVSFTKSFAEAYMAGVMEEEVNDQGKKTGMFKIKDGAEDDAMIPVNTDDVRGLIDGWTGDYFSEALKQLPKTTKTKIDW